MEDQTDRTLEDLRAAYLFAHLDEEQLAKLAALARPLSLPADSTLFLQGDPATALYLLAEGQIKVFKSLRDGRTATIRHVAPRQTFAEAALFHETYPSSTETMTASRLYGFDTDRFLDLMLAEPQLAVNLLGATAELLGLLNRRVEELLLPVPARLARYLLALADRQLEPPSGAPQIGAGPAAHDGPAHEEGAAPDDGPRVIRLPTSKRELAARLGTVPETLSRTFDRLKRAEVIRMSGDHELIEILSFEKLHRLAQD
jgi:CRP-like cAMP-binding protein